MVMASHHSSRLPTRAKGTEVPTTLRIKRFNGATVCASGCCATTPAGTAHGGETRKHFHPWLFVTWRVPLPSVASWSINALPSTTVPTRWLSGWYSRRRLRSTTYR